MIKVFVYGTLKPGERNYQLYCLGKVVEEKRAIAYGLLFALPQGYPAMALGSQTVQGFLLKFNEPNILVELDRLEGYNANCSIEQNLYQREQIQVYNQAKQPLDTAWVYLMSRNQISQRGGILLADGYWSSKVN